MRIWCQSGHAGDLRKTVYSESLKRHVQAVARPGTVVDLHSFPAKIPGGDSYASTHHLMGTLITKAAMQAELEGYDAFATTCTMDPGFFEVKEMVDIPVAFITESSLHLACLLAPKFGFVTHNEPMLTRLRHITRSYGLQEALAAGASMGLSFDDVFNGIYTNPVPYIDAFHTVARRVIAQGADILFTSGNPLNMFLVDNGVKEVDGVPILDVCAAVIKAAELMVDMKAVGINRSKHGLYRGPSGEARATLSGLYGL